MNVSEGRSPAPVKKNHLMMSTTETEGLAVRVGGPSRTGVIQSLREAGVQLNTHAVRCITGTGQFLKGLSRTSNTVRP